MKKVYGKTGTSNVREKASTSSTIVGTVNKSKGLEFVSKSRRIAGFIWYKVKLDDNKFGFVREDVSVIVDETKVEATTGRENPIVRIAKSYLGQKEVIQNIRFVDSKFDVKMRSVGFFTGAAWCCFFTKLVWNESGEETSVMNGSVQRSVKALRQAGYEISRTPIIGSLVVFESYAGGTRKSTGHIGVVVQVNDDNSYLTVEGNTNDKGGREGIMVASRHRHITESHFNVVNGMRLIGFVYPKVNR
jgi:hypothetical protein